MRLFVSYYLDEDVSVMLVDLLRARGIDVLAARDAALLGQPDEEHLSFARMQGRCIVTHNRAHFEELHIRASDLRQAHHGIVIASHQRDTYELARRLSRLADSLTADEIAGNLFYI